MGFGAIGGALLGGALQDRRASGGFSPKRGQLAGGTGFNPDVVREGHRMDNRYYHYRESLDWRKAVARGLTPQEYYGAGAPGNPGPSGGAQVLGNMAAQAAQANKVLLGNVMATAMSNRTALEQTRIQGQTARDVAKIQTGQQQRDLDQRIKEYQTIHLPLARQKLKMQEKEYEVLVNNVATSDPAYKRAITLLSMGSDNMVATFIAKKYGLNDPKDFRTLSEEDREKMLTEMIAASAKTRREIIGIFDQVKKMFFGGPPTLGDGDWQREYYEDEGSRRAQEQMNQW